MSVPVLLTILSSNTDNDALLDVLDEHMQNCTSFTEAATVISPPTANEVPDGSQANCKPVKHQFTVQLNAELESNEHVGLTGDCDALGEWQLERCITLQPNANAELQWTADITLESCRNISYRYFIYVQDKHERKQIRHWETQLQPRVLQSCDLECDAPQQVDRFGEVAGEGGVETQVNRGWLTNESIVQLKFEREKMFQVQDIDRFDPEDIQIKIVPLSDDLETALDHRESGINVEVAKLKYGESHLQAQQSYGISYHRGDVVVFHITAPNPLEYPFAVLFHSLDSKPLGKAIITAAQLTGSEGVLELNITEPIQESKVIIARLSLPYLIVKPFADTKFNFRTTYAHYWPKSWPNLDVGHRGNGRSYLADPPAERENTIASFMKAYELFADMIELDVHLTADGVPIIYHDYGIHTAPQGKKITRASQLEYVLIKDLSYEALKNLRVFAVIKDEPVEYPSHNAEARVDHRIFPSLVDVLEGLPKPLGMDIEIKWPQRRACGEQEADQTIDKNFFIDRVLSTIIVHSCGRPLIFSSFDADICTMLRFKQNIFPVMFLTMGQTKKWTPFKDLRTRTFEQAINNAQAFELAGTAPHAEDLLGDNGAQMMQKARQLGQIALVWGDDCNSKERVKYFIDIGATATCYDRTDLHMPEGKKRSFFNETNLLSEFEGQCRR